MMLKYAASILLAFFVSLTSCSVVHATTHPASGPLPPPDVAHPRVAPVAELLELIAANPTLMQRECLGRLCFDQHTCVASGAVLSVFLWPDRIEAFERTSIDLGAGHSTYRMVYVDGPRNGAVSTVRYVEDSGLKYTEPEYRERAALANFGLSDRDALMQTRYAFEIERLLRCMQDEVD